MKKGSVAIIGLICASVAGFYAYCQYSLYREAPYLVLRKIGSSYPKNQFDATYNVACMGKHWSMRVASDGKGHVRQEEDDPDAQARQVSLFDFPGKKVYWLQTQAKTAVVHALDGNGLGYADEETFRYDGKKLGSKRIAGQPCHGWTRQLAGQPMSSWFSDASSCLVESSIFGKDVRLRTLAPQAPAATEFKVPAGFQIKGLE